MKVRMRRVDSSLPLPTYQTAGAAAFDIYSREDVVIKPRELYRIPSNLIIETPKTHYLMITLRSSTPKKYSGLVVPHGVGIIDSDYRGAEDEVLVQVLNTSDTVIKIPRGDRFAQGTFVRIDRAHFVDNARIRGVSRGGFGSTS